MTDLKQIINTCGEITRSKGFDTTQHATQTALIATEVAEALECITPSGDSGTDQFTRELVDLCDRYEVYRKAIRKPECPYQDISLITNERHHDEEMADIVIRVFSYVGGNNRTEQFITALLAKIDVNRGRPEKHGKEF